jgi:hypothetical protein
MKGNSMGQCEVCGAPFEEQKGAGRPRKYCSRHCANVACMIRKTPMEVIRRLRGMKVVEPSDERR